MGQVEFKPGNMLYPLPAVLVTARGKDGDDHVLTIAWAGTVCTNPPMLTISVRPERHSYAAIKESGAFVVNLTTEALAKATDYCGVRSGRDGDKFKAAGLTKAEAEKVNAPVIAESPVHIECRVREVFPLGSHHMFLADVVHVTADERYLDERGTFRLAAAHPLVYSHGTYFGLGKELGSFGYSVRKAPKKNERRKNISGRGKIDEKAGKVRKNKR